MHAPQTLRVAFDAVTPPLTVPAGATAACIYAGGDTPNAIADPSTVPAYTQVRHWLPGWVRSDPTPGAAHADAAGMLAWLARNHAPSGIASFLDLETAVTPTYVDAYGAAMHAAGVQVLVYTSVSNMQQTPRLDGHFVADPGAQGLYPGSVATQHMYTNTYDLSYITPAVPLWDHAARKGDPMSGAGIAIPADTPQRHVVATRTGVLWHWWQPTSGPQEGRWQGPEKLPSPP